MRKKILKLIRQTAEYLRSVIKDELREIDDFYRQFA